MHINLGEVTGVTAATHFCHRAEAIGGPKRAMLRLDLRTTLLECACDYNERTDDFDFWLAKFRHPNRRRRVPKLDWRP